MKRLIKMASVVSLATFALPIFAQNVNPTPAPVNVSPEEKTKIEQVVHQYLLRNPEVVVEALQAMQRKQYDEAQQAMQQTQKDAVRFANALFHKPTDPIVGNPNGKITIVEFFDYQCSHCQAMAPTMAAIIKANPDLKVVYKEFPIRGDVSTFAAKAALAAKRQGKYEVLNKILLTSQEALTPKLILDKARQNGIDVARLEKDMNDPTIQNDLSANTKLAEDLKLLGTPAFFIAKSNVSDNQGIVYYIPGRMSEAQLQTEINKVNQQ